MTRFTKLLIGSVAVCGLVGVAKTTVVFAQEHAKPAGAHAQDAAAKKAAQAERMATFKKMLPSAKTSLAAAIEAAEKAAKGKAFSASFGLDKKGKALTLSVDLAVADKFVSVKVDPETGVAAAPKAGGEEDEEGEEGDEDDDGGGR